MRVQWAGTFDPEFSRNLKLARLLESSGAVVAVIREDVWAADRIALAQRPTLKVALSALVRYPKLLFRLLLATAPDLYLVSYPGWFDVPLVRLVASMKRRPLVFDPFVSLYDTMITDRRLHPTTSLIARMARLVDRWSLRLSDLVIADTEPHLEYYRQLAGGSGIKGVVVPVGADDGLFAPRGDVGVEPDMVLYYGKYVPLHGAGTIIEAAGLLPGGRIRLVMIGDGPDRPQVEATINRTAVAVERHGMLPLDQLPGYVARAAVCLGVFGDSDKASRVIPHKLYECLAMGRPVITRDSPAIRSLFGEGEVVTVPAADPGALAGAIQSLIDNPTVREQVASAGLEAYRSRFHEEPLAKLLDLALRTALDRRRPRL